MNDNFLLIHGINGYERQNFFPWLQEELESRNHSVNFPQLPGQENPNIDNQAAFLLKNQTFNESTVLFGHSLGATVALKVTENLDQPIKKLILAAGVAKHFNDKYAKGFKWDFDFDKIKKNAQEIVILRDSNDLRVPADHADILSKNLGTTITDFMAKGQHITGEVEPKILEVCLD